MSGFNPGEMDEEKNRMAKLTILAKSERNGQKSQNGHAKNRMALLTLLALLVSMDFSTRHRIPYYQRH